MKGVCDNLQTYLILGHIWAETAGLLNIINKHIQHWSLRLVWQKCEPLFQTLNKKTAVIMMKDNPIYPIHVITLIPFTSASQNFQSLNLHSHIYHLLRERDGRFFFSPREIHTRIYSKGSFFNPLFGVLSEENRFLLVNYV